MQLLLPLLVMAVLFPGRAIAYEADVHFGLTKWLAVQAGFTPVQAEAIATGNQRVDAGLMDTQFVAFEYGCNKPDVGTARAAQMRHFPSSGEVPSPPSKRTVAPNAAASAAQVDAVLQRDPKQAAFTLLKFGEALHSLQDAWAHQGVPGVPLLSDAGIDCDAMLSMTAPEARGSGHRSDIAGAWPNDTRDMAAETYATLLRYPAIEGIARQPADWKILRPQLDGFLSATTKSEKAAWFVSHGIDDVSFLDGISLRDGPTPWTAKWPGRRLPKLAWDGPFQADAPDEARLFFKTFLAAWLTGTDPAAALNAEARRRGSSPAAATRQMELAARLRLWRVHDHGSVADLVHKTAPLNAAQMRLARKLTSRPSAYVRYETPADAFFPLMAVETYATPVLPFLIRPLPATSQGLRRMMAVAKLRHAPYDEVAFVAEQRSGGWEVVSVVGLVDH